jgi:hypothetical protein
VGALMLGRLRLALSYYLQLDYSWRLAWHKAARAS